MNITVYGISNCDTVKKARTWLQQHAIDFHFHDFRKDGLDAVLVAQMLAALGIEKVVNKRGTTWRQLNADQQAQVLSPAASARLLVEHPTLIKRPVIAIDDHWQIGFSKQDQQALSDHLGL
ncbi:MAG: ArsC family reductase [Rhodospirillaceae bacterium]